MRTLLLTFWLLFFLYGSAQNAQIADSLITVLEEKDVNDSLSFELHLDLSFYHPKPLQSLYHAQQALFFAKKLKSDTKRAFALEALGLSHYLLGNKVESYNSTYEALSIYDEYNLSREQAAIQLQIGSNKTLDGNYEEAFHHFRKSVQLFRSLNDKYREALGAVNLGEAFRLNGQLDSAERWFNRALSLNVTKNRAIIEAYSLGNLGMTHHAQGKWGEALPALSKAVEVLNVLDDPASIVIYEAEIGQLLIKQGQEEEGISKIVASFELAKAENLKEQIKELSGMLTQLYSKRAVFDQAYFYQRQYQIYQDSLVNPESIREIEKAKSTYELDKQQKEAAIVLAETRRKMMYIGSVLILFALLLAVSYYAYRGKKKANKELSLKNGIISRQAKEKELLHREMHHRVKNNLQLVSSIMGLHARNAEDKQVSDAIVEGKSRMEAMSLIHQNLYGENENTLVELHEYLEELVVYFKSIYQGKLQEIALQIDPVSVDADDSIPIGLVVNEAVCNSVKYGASSELGVSISFLPKGAAYVLEIADTGSGFDEATVGDGFGTTLIKTLARQLRAELEISTSPEGTTIRLTMSNQVVKEKAAEALV